MIDAERLWKAILGSLLLGGGMTSLVLSGALTSKYYNYTVFGVMLFIPGMAVLARNDGLTATRWKNTSEFGIGFVVSAVLAIPILVYRHTSMPLLGLELGLIGELLIGAGTAVLLWSSSAFGYDEYAFV